MKPPTTDHYPQRQISRKIGDAKNRAEVFEFLCAAGLKKVSFDPVKITFTCSSFVISMVHTLKLSLWHYDIRAPGKYKLWVTYNNPIPAKLVARGLRGMDKSRKIRDLDREFLSLGRRSVALGELL